MCFCLCTCVFVSAYVYESSCNILALNLQSYLISLLQFNPALLHLSEKGVSFLTRFFSTRKGLSRMKQLGEDCVRCEL